MSSYRSRKIRYTHGTRNFSEPKGTIIFYLSKLPKKKEEGKKIKLYLVKFG